MCSCTFLVVFLSGIIISLLLKYVLVSLKGADKHASDKEALDLAVCIISARHNFEQRQAIRETWLLDLPKITSKNVKAFFVVGDTACDIPPLDRLDPHTCEEWTPEVPEKSDIAAFSLQKINTEEVYSQPAIRRLAISVLHPVTVKRLGIRRSFTGPVSVTLWDGVTDEELVSVVFNRMDPGIDYQGYRYQPIQPILLPKGFHGELATNLTETEDHSFTSQDNQWYQETGNYGRALSVQGMKEDRTFTDLTRTADSLLSFMFSVEDISDLQNHILSRKQRQAQWGEHLKMESDRLLQEVREHADVMFVNVTDVYRHLPHKLLSCHHWLHAHADARFVLKTDDDCFVDLVKVTNDLHRLTSVQKLWWGQFRDEWLVERHGKWREMVFPSSTYPRFACGSGNIVSRDVHTWIAASSGQLHPYQGEDVSLGMWLAAIGPHYEQASAWQCAKQCEKGSYVLPELSVDEIRTYWDRKQQCGDPCGMCHSGAKQTTLD
ncbi:UDP-GalNAc:beta-1,3-N-acetylgalactosaminyltransferase 2-like [Haliotis asinina]|uniref:UDP-GalNAc:beta-1, 3-N-acetylgalactosaminyltransferase 2-like n=1 Tax=Haliotis asinina TaxID=109174 RepID=UPI00353193F3